MGFLVGEKFNAVQLQRGKSFCRFYLSKKWNKITDVNKSHLLTSYLFTAHEFKSFTC